ncbi:MAG: L,D-transpeptidase family protein [Bosea sp. (in: a-proteobacteria)]
MHHHLNLIAAVALLAAAPSLVVAQGLQQGGSTLPSDRFFEPRPAEAKPVEARPAESRPAESRPADARVARPSEEPAAGEARPKPKVAAKPKAKPAPAPARETALTSDPRITFTPDTAALTALASERYLGIAESGGWRPIPAGVTLQAGSKGASVGLLRRRLALSGDLTSGDEDGQNFDASLTAAVKRFQMRHGLRQTGVVSGRTLAELNVTAQQRFRQLASSAERLAGSNFPFGQRYVVVNIPSASVEAVEDGVVKRRYVAVVGKPDRASPTVETRITSVNLNPTWTVPTSIIKKDIIPKMQKDPGYLAKNKIRILNNKGEEINASAIDWKTERAAAFTLRQDPGTGNSLGLIKIDMPNKLAVYMHDTPTKKLFGRDDRFHSSGCVRVENVKDFAAWLLEHTPGYGHAMATGWDKAAIETGIASKERKDVRLKQAVPVAWVYMTGYATADGTVHFRPDVYSMDRIGSTQPQPADGALGSPQAKLN